MCYKGKLYKYTEVFTTKPNIRNVKIRIGVIMKRSRESKRQNDANIKSILDRRIFVLEKRCTIGYKGKKQVSGDQISPKKM